MLLIGFVGLLFESLIGLVGLGLVLLLIELAGLLFGLLIGLVGLTVLLLLIGFAGLLVGLLIGLVGLLLLASPRVGVVRAGGMGSCFGFTRGFEGGFGL